MPPKLLVLVGPTAVGKSALAIQLAERLGGEIISADSRTLYRGLDIGTAKPSPEDRARVPHHLIDVTDPDQPWSLAQYRDAALGHMAAIWQRGRRPMLVGGTGQYVRAVLEGWSIPPRPADPAYRLQLEALAQQHGPDALFAGLQAADPAAAELIDKRNLRRVIRALEVIHATGQPFSAQRQKQSPAYPSVILGLTLPRPILYARIDARVDAMLAHGLVDEVRSLAARYDWSLPALSAIGYKQIGMYLRGECDLAEAVRLIKHDTRRYVRQQANWFRAADPAIHWHDVESLDADQWAAEINRLQ
ncbi:MAG: tRNA (adenosine(37)-N6)-dimethylallyltransferase MiaA [Chloroflexi bacterium]|nr:tRNA (adenosine(37)-N6)-dimethylallyltransferase MiaA [Chloroflexota bacterium]